MKKIAIITLLVLLTGCAGGRYTRPARDKSDVVYVEKTLRQNLIDLGITLLGAGVIVWGNAEIADRQSNEFRDGMPTMPAPIINVPIPIP